MVSPILLSISVTINLIICLSSVQADRADFRVYNEDQFTKEINRKQLTTKQKHNIIDACLQLLSDINPNLAAFENLLNQDPIKELKSLRRTAFKEENYEFHEYNRYLFNRLEDYHTVYVPPYPFDHGIATLGFQTRLYYDNKGKPHLMKYDVDPNYPYNNAKFPFGSEILQVDGWPALRKAFILGEDFYTFSEANKLYQGAKMISIRRMDVNELPTPEFSTIKYRNAKTGKIMKLRRKWMYLYPKKTTTPRSRAVLARMVKNANFSYPFKRETDSFSMKEVDVMEPLKDYISAYVMQMTGHDDVAYLHVHSLLFEMDDEAVDEFKRLFSLLPKGNLLLRVTGLTDGFFHTARAFIHMISGKDTPQVPIVVRASNTWWKLAQTAPPEDFSITGTDRAFYAIRDARNRGAYFTRAFGDLFNHPETGTRAELPDQLFSGTILVVTAPYTSTMGEGVTSWLKDSGCAYVVGLGGWTTGSTAIEINYGRMRNDFPKIFKYELPKGLELITGLSGFTRSFSRMGGEIDYVGIEPDEVYKWTKMDVIDEYYDFYRFLVKKFDML